MSFLKCLPWLALVAVLDAARFKCDYTLYKDAGGYLKFQEMPVTFDEAKQRCTLEGGTLASPINDGIKAAMMGILNNSKVDFLEIPLRTAAFTGIFKKSNSYGIFSSVEGILLSEIPHTWAFDEPNNRENKENCIAILPDGTIADVACEEPLPHFCFLKEVKAKTLNECGSKNKDYKLNTSTGSCYKFHNTPLDYDEAAEVCKKEGGHLLIINGDTEAEAVNETLTEKKIVSTYIGFRYNHDLGEWMTIQGETINEAGYEKWLPGEPNNLNNNEYCGTLKHVSDLNFRMMNDEECGKKFLFICEKDPVILLCK